MERKDEAEEARFAAARQTPPAALGAVEGSPVDAFQGLISRTVGGRSWAGMQ